MKVKSSVFAAATAVALSASVAGGAVESEAAPVLERGEFAGHISYRGGAGHDEETGAILYSYAVQEMSEPRLDGDIVLAVTSNYLNDYGRMLWHGSFRIETEDGAWQEPPHLTLEYLDGTATTHTSAFIGEGDYKGLTALIEMTYLPTGKFDLRGVITEDSMPPLPVRADDHPE